FLEGVRRLSSPPPTEPRHGPGGVRPPPAHAGECSHRQTAPASLRSPPRIGPETASCAYRAILRAPVPALWPLLRPLRRSSSEFLGTILAGPGGFGPSSISSGASAFWSNRNSLTGLSTA